METEKIGDTAMQANSLKTILESNHIEITIEFNTNSITFILSNIFSILLKTNVKMGKWQIFYFLT